MSKTLRLYGDTHDELKSISAEEETFNDTLERILPEEAKVVEHPEDKVVAVTVDDEVHRQVMEMAGQNVNVSHVIQYYINEYKYPRGTI